MFGSSSAFRSCCIETDNKEAYRVVGGAYVNLRERLAGLDANVDDVQAGAEATSRAADTLIADTAQFNGLLKGSLLRLVVRHVNELRACALDQRTALQDLRDSIVRLRQELKMAQRAAIRPPPLSMAASKRG